MGVGRRLEARDGNNTNKERALELITYVSTLILRLVFL